MPLPQSNFDVKSVGLEGPGPANQEFIVKARLALMLAVLCLAFAAVGCRRYAGGTSGSQLIPGSTLQNCSVFQHDTYEGEWDKSKRRPLFAIVWQAKIAGSSATDNRNLTTSIHGHPVALSPAKKAVYALQPDYSLQEIALSEQEIDHLFAIADSDPDDGLRFASDAVWREKVEPFLRIVEQY